LIVYCWKMYMYLGLIFLVAFRTNSPLKKCPTPAPKV